MKTIVSVHPGVDTQYLLEAHKKKLPCKHPVRIEVAQINDSAAELKGQQLTNNGSVIRDYKLIKTIGEGAFAKVKLAINLVTKEEVAIKIIDKSKLSKTEQKRLHREVRIMKMLDHPNIIKLYEVVETEYELLIIMEYAKGGEVFDYLAANGKMKQGEARKTFRQIISAVQYCHRNKVIHRDLKAENLLLDENMSIKIADFGFSNVYKPGAKLETFCGSPCYAAPELLSGKRYEGPEVDIWSLGVILYTLVCGYLPFEGDSVGDLTKAIVVGTYDVPVFVTSDCEQMLKCFLQVNPQNRKNIDEIMTHKWLNIGYDTLLVPYIKPEENPSPPTTKNSETNYAPKYLKLEEPKQARHSMIERVHNSSGNEPTTPSKKTRQRAFSCGAQATPTGAVGGQRLRNDLNTKNSEFPFKESNNGPKPRSVRFTMSINTTSTKPAEELMVEIKRILSAQFIEFHNSDPFTVSCSHFDNKNHITIWEMEVCRLPRLNMHGVRFKRISGNSVDYKNILATVISALKL